MILPPPFITRISFLLLWAAALIRLNGHAQLFPDQDPSIDYYCGINWKEANTYCNLPCPSGNDTDCPPVQSTGRERYCLASAGCAARMESLYWTGTMSLEFDKDEHVANGSGGAIMSGSDMNVFQSSLMLFLGDGVKVLDKMEITCVEVQDQEYDRPCVGAVVPDRRLYELERAGNSTIHVKETEPDSELTILTEEVSRDVTSIQQHNRKLSRDESITALDMTVQVCAQYIPTLDGTNKITESDLENDIFRIIANREKGAVAAISSSSNFFKALTGITVISSDIIVDPPSSSPSESPTRSQFQTIETYIDSNPSGSYGIFFSVRTHANVSTILLTGMSFLTPYDGMVEYEVYSRIGGYVGYEGSLYEWDLIAKAQTVGGGAGNLTRVLDEDPVDDDLGYVGFAPIHVPGNKGMRSFYVTMTNTIKMPDGVPVPISFSASQVPENEGLAKYDVVVSNEELEILEGDGVLDYPAPRNDESSLYYRRPRGFIGSFSYTKEACYPTVDFFGWPCPYMPKNKLPTKLPTKSPSIAVEQVSLNPNSQVKENSTDAFPRTSQGKNIIEESSNTAATWIVGWWPSICTIFSMNLMVEMLL